MDSAETPTCTIVQTVFTQAEPTAVEKHPFLQDMPGLCRYTVSIDKEAASKIAREAGTDYFELTRRPVPGEHVVKPGPKAPKTNAQVKKGAGLGEDDAARLNLTPSSGSKASAHASESQALDDSQVEEKLAPFEVTTPKAGKRKAAHLTVHATEQQG